MNFLELVNYVIQETGLELNELDSTTWASPEAGRRIYPRLKRYVQQSWKQIQMSRNQWEFKSAEVSELVYPRFKFEDGFATIAPVAGDQFTGADSGFTFTVRQVILDSGAWIDGDAVGQIEFEIYTETQPVVAGELFEEVGAGDGTFIYLRRGSYDFGLTVTDLAEIQWGTFIIQATNSSPIPGIFIPYANWMYEAYSYATGSISPPAYVSQDYEGNVVFLHQSYRPFRVTFIYAVTPQQLLLYTDIPTGLHPQYHEWIAWEAVKRQASYDKNTPLMAHAETNIRFFKNRAETNLMPLVSWQCSKFNE